MSAEVIVIGAGPAGLMAAISSAQKGARTLLLEKNEVVGRKLRLTGGGRCNLTNSADLQTIINNIPGNGRFLYSALSQFSNRDIINFFEKENLPLKEEDNGRMFPVTDKAADIIEVLIKKARQLNVDIRTESPVRNIPALDSVILTSGETLKARSIIVATGGSSFPHTGSTGEAYGWLTHLGHTITELYPAEVGILSTTTDLQGLSLQNISIEVFDQKHKRITKHQGDILFTHYGLSGPAALRCSSHIHLALKKYNLQSLDLTLDLFPGKNHEELSKVIFAKAEKDHNKAIKTILSSFVPKRLVSLILIQAEIPSDTTFPQISKKSWNDLISTLKCLRIPVTGTRPLKEAFVTGGGVSTKEVDPKTMQSKIVPGLFLAGEVLDISGYTGGFNITAAMSTGFVAGTHAAIHANSPLLR